MVIASLTTRTVDVVELTNVGSRVQSVSFQPVATLATTACIYLALTTLLTQLSGALEQYKNKQQQLGAAGQEPPADLWSFIMGQPGLSDYGR